MRRAVFNNKGGVGKTSVTCNLAAALALEGQRVLVVDIDPQANATLYLSGDESGSFTETMSDFYEATLATIPLFGQIKLPIYPTKHRNLWLAPSERSLADIQGKLESRFKILKLKKAIDQAIDRYKFDQVLFDTPPALNVFAVSALLAADTVIIPFDCDAFSLEALCYVDRMVREMAEDHGTDLAIEGVIVNQFQKQAKHPASVVARVSEHGLKVLTPYLSSSVAMRESRNEQIPLVFMQPNHRLSQEFRELAKSLVHGPDTANASARKTKPAPIKPQKKRGSSREATTSLKEPALD